MLLWPLYDPFSLSAALLVPLGWLMEPVPIERTEPVASFSGECLFDSTKLSSYLCFELRRLTDDQRGAIISYLRVYIVRARAAPC